MWIKCISLQRRRINTLVGIGFGDVLLDKADTIAKCSCALINPCSLPLFCMLLTVNCDIGQVCQILCLLIRTESR